MLDELVNPQPKDYTIVISSAAASRVRLGATACASLKRPLGGDEINPCISSILLIEPVGIRRAKHDRPTQHCQHRNPQSKQQWTQRGHETAATAHQQNHLFYSIRLSSLPTLYMSTHPQNEARRVGVPSPARTAGRVPIQAGDPAPQRCPSSSSYLSC